MDRSDDDAKPRAWALVLPGLLAIALALRLPGIAAKGMWIDEAYSIHLARLDFGSLLAALGRESTPPGYYLLLHAWISLFGDGALAARLLSVAFGVAAVGALWIVTCDALEPRFAALACAFFALSPIHVYYSQETRMYSMLAFLAVCLAGFALAWRRTGSRAALSGFAAAAVALLLTHNVSLWLVAAFFLALLFTVPDRGAARDLIVAGGAVLVAWTPWLVVLLRQVRGQSVVLDWFRPIWESKSALLHVLDTVWSFGFGPYPLYLMLGPSAGEAWPARVALVAALAIGAWRLLGRPASRIVLAASTAAVALAVLYSILVQPVYIPGRTELYLAPFFAWLLAAAVDWMRPRAVGWGFVGVFAALALAVLLPFYRDGSKNESLTFLAAIREQARGGDWIVTTGRTFAETEYYVRRWNVPAQLRSFPEDARLHPGYVSWDEMLADPAALQAQAAALAAAAEAPIAAGGRLFLILIANPANDPLLIELDRRFALESDSGELYRQAVTGIAVRVLAWKRRSDPPAPGRPPG